ncbi:MAG: 30S ribosomal protein S16 [Candidatus Komeilibacteria bacterium RIFOXYC1_FULL_37_11]|uniref:Small ribosomal subunit protein bS16 n=1 Tax=Candidatus Komeilibacteria bacterium RIFOXYC1_FULL_37_11 TaxID=1798555 RepID=A0A1G2C2K6_9BACT|nr:MAG: 30S ribosomal protein S16 [Candidatus Komeilibacteria bacterium RIFOXYC1_FULL_37_11]OGY95949.1 MAG: 30S ribosomal protein S16 [Candidatus Komeilibacteria bacterium RIFOXYD1_FULL_37_29]
MLAIRLQRIGRKKQPLYRLVISEKTKDTQGNHLENLGQYNPHKKEAIFKAARIKYWISKGAKASASVNNILIKEGIVQGAKQKSVSITKTRAAKMEAKKAENAKEAPAPAVEVKEEVAK